MWRVRGKYTLFDADGFGFAAAAELRLPTGDSDNLLGAGQGRLPDLGARLVRAVPLRVHANLSAPPAAACRTK